MGNKQTKTAPDEEATKRIEQFHKDMTERRLSSKEPALKTHGYYDRGKKGYDAATARWENWSKKYPHEDWESVHPDNYEIFSCENITDLETCKDSSCVWEPKMPDWIDGKIFYKKIKIFERIENPDWISQQNHHTSSDIERLNTQGGICKNQLEHEEIRQPTRTRIRMKKANKKGSRLNQLRLDGLTTKKKDSGLRRSAVDSRPVQPRANGSDALYTGEGNDGNMYVFFHSEIDNGMYSGKNLINIHKVM